MTRRYTGGFLSAKEQATDANTASGIFTAHEAGALTAAGIFPTGRWTPQRSLRFRRSASAYLTRTPSSASGQDKWTLSTWVKRGALGDSSSQIIGGNTTTSGGTRNVLIVEFGSDNTLQVYGFTNASGYYFQRVSNQLFRDPSAWYHLVVQFDPDNAISDNKVIAYINGQRLSWSTSSDSGAAGNIGSSSYRSINNTFRNDINGGYQGGGVPVYFGDQYLSEMYMISASLVEPSAFAMTDPQTGTWIPKRYTGTYGTNGFYLDFRDNSAASAGAIGADRSGNGNNWTPNSISVTAGVTNDSMVDVPGIASVSSQTDVGGVVRGNYCTWSPVFFGNLVTYSDANLTAFSSNNGVKNTYGSIAVDTGKWYFEETIASQSDAYRAYLGFAQPINVPDGFYLNDVPGFAATWNVGNTSVSYGTQSVLKSSGAGSFEFTTATVSDTKSVGDVYMFAYDGTSGKIWFGKNGTWFSSGSPSTGANPAGTLNTQFSYTPACNLNVTGAGNSVTLNCGQRPFAYTPPVGFKSINTTNLPNPVIKRSNDHFDVKTYTGNGTSLQVGTTQKQSSAYQINKSIRFRKPATTTLNKTFAIAPTSRTTMTMSAWVKRGSLSASSTMALFGTSNNYENVTFFTDDTIRFTGPYASAQQGIYVTNQKFTDTTAWYHIVAVYDTTNLNPLRRMRLYVNGSEITSFSTQTVSNINNTTTEFLVNGFTTGVGTTGGSGTGSLFDGYMAEVNVIDGQALTAESFGQFDANNNWTPKAYTGTYGNNGFYLKGNAVSTATGAITTTSSTWDQYLKRSDNATGWAASSITIQKYPLTYDFVKSGFQSGSWGADFSFTLPSEPNGNATPAYIQFTFTDGTERTLFGTGGNIPSINPFNAGQSGASNGRLVWDPVARTLSENTSTYGGSVTVNATYTGKILSGIRVYGGFSGSTGTLGYTSLYQNNTFVFGTDSSGNSNTFTTYNLDLNSGSTYDLMLDSPTDTVDSSGNTVGNYATIDTNNNSGLTISNAGLSWVGAAGATRMAYGTLPFSSGKWYFEYTMTQSNSGGNWAAGFSQADVLQASGSTPFTNPNTWGIMTGGNATVLYKVNNNVFTNLSGLWSGTLPGAVIGVAVDFDAGKVWFSKDNVWVEGDPSAGTTPSYTGINAYGQLKPIVYGYNTGDIGIANFGQRAFAYTPPTGFKALNTKNLKDVGSFNLPDTFGNYVNTPDLVWIKRRNSSSQHVLSDTVRGPDRELFSSSTSAQQSGTGGKFLRQFEPNGFELGPSDSGTGDVNISGGTYVSWAWNRGKTSGFDIVNYGGRGAGTTFEHNLGVEPSFVIIKCTSTTGNWITYHKSLTRDKYLYVNSTGGEQSQTNAWIPTSNSFSITQDWTDAATSGRSFVAYLWAEVPGFSKFGRYTGNNATNGPFIYTGFRPRFVMIKRTDTTGNWSITDTAINPFNIALTPALRPNTAETESTVGTVYVQPLSNGFKITNNNSDTNASGTYVYAAYAENPFKYGNAR
jgi:hypothetical protein